jgi:hypothetical protein
VAQRIGISIRSGVMAGANIEPAYHICHRWRIRYALVAHTARQHHYNIGEYQSARKRLAYRENVYRRGVTARTGAAAALTVSWQRERQWRIVAARAGGGMASVKKIIRRYETRAAPRREMKRMISVIMASLAGRSTSW